MLATQRFTIGPHGTTIFGAGCVAELPGLLARLGARRVLLVSDEGVLAATGHPLPEPMENVDLTVFSAIRANPTLADLDAGALTVRPAAPEAIVALGGGSVLDAAKGLALMAANEGPAADFDYRQEPARPGVPIIAVPTTAGTGSECNGFGVIEDPATGRKMYLGHASVVPRFILLDPTLTLALPARATAAAGVDAMVHALESLSSRNSNPYAEGLALQVVRMVCDYLPRAVADGEDLEARAQLQLAAHMASLAMGTTGLGLAHGIGHALSARLGVAHGVALAALLPNVLHFNLPVCAAVYARVAVALNVADPSADDEVNAQRAIETIRAFIAELGLLTALSDFGLTRSLIPTIATDALADEVTANTPRLPEEEQVEALLRQAL